MELHENTMRKVFFDSKVKIQMAQSILFLLLCSTMIFNSCSKEKQHVAATLNLRFSNNIEETEWMEVQGSRNDQNGEMEIDAQGFADERFSLNLQNFGDTGNVPVAAITRLLISDGLGFHSQQIQSGFLRIIEKKPDRLYAVFEFYFQNSLLVSNSIKAEGSFQILDSR
jgi:hypothetical protein